MNIIKESLMSKGIDVKFDALDHKELKITSEANNFQDKMIVSVSDVPQLSLGIVETFFIMLEPERGHICELFDVVYGQLDLFVEHGSAYRSYRSDEMRLGNRGCLLITLLSKGDGEKTLRDILKKTTGIKGIYMCPFDTCLTAFNEFVASKK